MNKGMTKKQFAMIMTSLEMMRKMNEMATNVIDGKQVTKAYASCKEIKAMTDKFLADFGNTDPRWTPQKAQMQAAQVQTMQPAIEYEVEQ